MTHISIMPPTNARLPKLNIPRILALLFLEHIKKLPQIQAGGQPQHPKINKKNAIQNA